MFVVQITPIGTKSSKVLLDNSKEYLIDNETLCEFCINKDSDINEEKLAEIIELSSYKKCFNNALNFLEYRDHAEKELINKLRHKGYSSSSIDKTIEKLKSISLIDDVKFANEFCNELVNHKKYGQKRVLEELYRKGISKEIAEIVISNFEFSSSSVIKEILQSKFNPIPSGIKEKQKIYSYLIRRGFSYDEINSVLYELTNDNSEV